MAHNNHNFNELDVDKLFEEHTISEILAIENLLDIEIERKRIELRGMVGDRYKDVLTAWDAIKSMKNVSEDIVYNIESIIEKCEYLIAGTVNEDEPIESVVPTITPKVIQERTIIIEIRLAMAINSQIWIALEEEDFSKAAQLYLLAQHIHIGLQLLNKDILNRLPILKRTKADIDVLRQRILKRTKEKLQTVELNVEETSSNLNVLMLLEQYNNNTELINIFIQLRKAALNMVINEQHNSVRAQVTAMLRCLITTVHLLHECFINYGNSDSGLIWQELKNIVSESAPPTLSKLALPPTPLIVYIPDLVKNFRPKWTHESKAFSVSQISGIITSWLEETSHTIKTGLKKSLELITNIKGLHFIREEAFKIELPVNWTSMCRNINLPDGFNVWLYFFQSLITNRAKELMLKKLTKSSEDVYDKITKTLAENVKSERTEKDLRWYIWKEEEGDVSRYEDKHIGLSMKTKGYSSKILNLCTNLDNMYLQLLEDLSLYLHGKEHASLQNAKLLKSETNSHNKHVDKDELEKYLKLECVNHCNKLTAFLETFFNCEEENEVFITKSLICARFLQALSELCPNFKRCCSCNDSTNEWSKVVENFGQSSLRFWNNWLKNSIVQGEVGAKDLQNIDPLDMLHTLPKWENFEIQEQTDEKIFKSQIKLPSQPSLCLQKIFNELNNQLNAVIPHTLPKQIHLQFVEGHTKIILDQYEVLSKAVLNQTQALQFLFDVKFLTALCIARENLPLVTKSQSICDKLRSQIDPFDLDVFYSYLQTNIKMSVLQSQVILGCLLPSMGQLSSLGILEKNKDHENEPSVLAVSIPSTVSWFPLLPVTAPLQKVTQASSVSHTTYKDVSVRTLDVSKKPNSVSSVRSGAAAFFGAMTTDWFS
ncbi:hypothetical protein FQR65_LT09461 [Abscondita terminalis]|nr:hypothetical protein FQR65_LT09461 [Abscondita terminalis]